MLAGAWARPSQERGFRRLSQLQLPSFNASNVATQLGITNPGTTIFRTAPLTSTPAPAPAPAPLPAPAAAPPVVPAVPALPPAAAVLPVAPVLASGPAAAPGNATGAAGNVSAPGADVTAAPGEKVDTVPVTGPILTAHNVEQP